MKTNFSLSLLYHQNVLPAHKIKNYEMKHFYFPHGWTNDNILDWNSSSGFTRQIPSFSRNWPSPSYWKVSKEDVYWKEFPRELEFQITLARSLENTEFNSVYIHVCITLPFRCFMLVQWKFPFEYACVWERDRERECSTNLLYHKPLFLLHVAWNMCWDCPCITIFLRHDKCLQLHFSYTVFNNVW